MWHLHYQTWLTNAKNQEFTKEREQRFLVPENYKRYFCIYMKNKSAESNVVTRYLSENIKSFNVLVVSHVTRTYSRQTCLEIRFYCSRLKNGPLLTYTQLSQSKNASNWRYLANISSTLFAMSNLFENFWPANWLQIKYVQDTEVCWATSHLRIKEGHLSVRTNTIPRKQLVVSWKKQFVWCFAAPSGF